METGNHYKRGEIRKAIRVGKIKINLYEKILFSINCMQCKHGVIHSLWRRKWNKQ